MIAPRTWLAHNLARGCRHGCQHVLPVPWTTKAHGSTGKNRNRFMTANLRTRYALVSLPDIRALLRASSFILLVLMMLQATPVRADSAAVQTRDRKSTRLNSSH